MLLDDPGARAQLLAALDEKPEPWYRAVVAARGTGVGDASVAVLAVVAIRQNARPVPTGFGQHDGGSKAGRACCGSVRRSDQAGPGSNGVALDPTAIRAKRQSAPPEQASEKRRRRAGLPQPPVREARPAGAAGGCQAGGVPAAAPVAPNARSAGAQDGDAGERPGAGRI